MEYALIDWASILREHGPTVWRTVYRMVNDMNAAYDCYQETFLAAVQMSRKSTVDNWQATLRTIAARKAIDHLRRRRVAGAHLRLVDNLDTQSADGEVVELKMENEELRRRVRSALTELPPRQAEAFWLRHMEQMPVAQVAQALNTSPGNVAVLLNRAAARLRQLLSNSEYAPVCREVNG
ncbi:MAG: sigma-70 family RNA polymerase sigma factor [Phycisphaeraceae bacterium]|nr:sigma-70 family RNA polymerase sigma factor [Phycisphaeraceae bacterium]